MEPLAPPPRNLTSCKRGPEGRRPILYLPRLPGAPSVLQLNLAPEVECDVQLAPRYTRLLLAAVDAWHADEGEIETLRGFRTAAELGEHCGELSHVGVSISEEAVRAYVHEIKTHIARAVDRLFPRKRVDIPVPVLFETRRILGYRINRCGLEIVQARPRKESDN
jgi:hypothetical protein